MPYSSKYTFEVWNRNGQLLADISFKALSRRIVQSRNRPESISFTLDLDDIENYCRSLKVDPKDVFIVDSADIRVKRHGKYLVGGQINYRNARLGSRQNTYEIRAIGFLGLFGYRYTGVSTAGTVSEVYMATNGTALSRRDLAWSLINQSQGLTNGNFGITRGVTGGSDIPHDKTYSRTNIQDALQALTELQTDAIDIEFTHDKKFNTYASIGSNRPDILFEYPGNITNIEAPDDGTDIANEIIALGSGAADGTQVVVVQSDIPSQTDRYLRQDVINTAGTNNADNGITDAAVAKLSLKRKPLRIPSLTVNGNLAPFITDYGIGDYVKIKVANHPTVSDINGTYRIEKRTINIDENDNEEVILEVSA